MPKRLSDAELDAALSAGAPPRSDDFVGDDDMWHAEQQCWLSRWQPRRVLPLPQDKRRRTEWDKVTKQHARAISATSRRQDQPESVMDMCGKDCVRPEATEDVTTVIIEPQRCISSSDLRKQQRHVREYERALKRGPPAAAVHGQWRTWLHRPVLRAILQWAETHAPDGSKEWYDDVRLVARNARTGSDDSSWEWENTFGIPYNVESYEEYSGRDTWAASMCMSLYDDECDHSIPVSSYEYGRYEDGT